MVTFNAAGYPSPTSAQPARRRRRGTTTTREPNNLPLTSTDALGRTSSRTYDAQGNVLSVTRLSGTADAVTSSYTYQAPFNGC